MIAPEKRAAFVRLAAQHARLRASGRHEAASHAFRHARRSMIAAGLGRAEQAEIWREGEAVARKDRSTQHQESDGTDLGLLRRRSTQHQESDGTAAIGKLCQHRAEENDDGEQESAARTH